MVNDSKTTIKELIGKDIKRFFELYKKHIVLPEAILNDFLAIESRFNRTIKDTSKGLLSATESDKQLNQITDSLLSLLDQLDDTHYIANLSESDTKMILGNINFQLISSQVQIEELKKQVDNLKASNYNLTHNLARLELMVLEDRIFSYDTQSHNFELAHITRYLKICKEHTHWCTFKVDGIIDALYEYSKKSSQEVDYELNDLIDALEGMGLSSTNKIKVEVVFENFGLK